MELHEALMIEGVSAVIHTILFLRAPNLVKPEDHVCELLAPLCYAKCGPLDVDNTVTQAITSLQNSLTSVGPYLSKGMIVLSFFEKREVKGFFGLVSNPEKVYFERWRIPIVVDSRELLHPSSPSQRLSGEAQTNAADTERRHLLKFARDVVQKRLLAILEVRRDEDSLIINIINH